MKDFVRRISQKISKLSSEQLERIIDDLSAENNSFDSILESLSTGLLIVDSDWKLLQHNKASERLLPFSVSLKENRAENMPLWLLIDDESIADFLKACFDGKKTNAEDEFSLVTDANVRFLTISVVPLVRKERNDETNVSSAHIDGSVITIDDITEKRQQEILLHRMESLASLTNLAASVAHEIKNPLGAISIHIQLLQKSIKKARQNNDTLPEEKFLEHYLDIVNEEIDTLNKIVLDFLFAVRPVQANPELTSPEGILSNLTSFFEPELTAKGISLTCRFSKRDTRILVDPKLFREVIVNLIQNAQAAILERFPQNSLMAERTVGFQEKQNGEIVMESSFKNETYILTIADNGCGMDEKTSARIFEPYYTTKANGTGLGLTTVYKIIKEFRGDISVQSVKGHGTAFTITLPVPQRGVKLLPEGTHEIHTADN